MGTEQNKAITLFYCYAREDEKLLNELEKHLAPLKRQGYLISWHNRQIEAGNEWQKEIERRLSTANLILILLSPDFAHSDACYDEMLQAMKLHKAGQARVIPILLRPVYWEGIPLAGLEGLPENGQPITTWPDWDLAFRQIAYHLASIVFKLLNLPPLQMQDWQALSSPIRQKQPPFSISLFEDDPSFVPRNPYRGLHAFKQEHTADFFGRDNLIKELLQTLQQIVSLPTESGNSRLLSVIGPSGSGKSSVVLAGLLPALQQGNLPGSEHWTYLEPIEPGQHPLEALARTLSYQFQQRSLTSLREDLAAPGARGLHLLLEALSKGKSTTQFLYIDQFEEVFTQTLDVNERQQFLQLLLTALTEPHSTLALTISLRADFYDRPMLYIPQLFRLMKIAQVEVLSLDQRGDLRDVIKKPAALPDVKLRFEDDLVGELLDEMRGQIGALPLLQFTLDRLFQERQGQIMTLAAYHNMGGVQGALARHAEATYASLPTEEHRILTRALFLCLVEPGAIDQNPTRRRVIIDELVLKDHVQVMLLEFVTTLFTEARLLTTASQDGKTIVEMSHETIIRGWTRLVDWLRDAHEDLYLQRRIREDAAVWIKQGSLVIRLYRDEQLAEALAWKQRMLLSQNEEQFLLASVREHEQRQLLIKRKEAEQQQQYRRRIILVGLGGLGLAAVAAVVNSAILSKNNNGVLSKNTGQTPVALPYIAQGHTNTVRSVAWSPDGKFLASASTDNTVRIWDAVNGQTLHVCRGHTNAVYGVYSVAWSPDGKFLASAGADNTVRIWDATSGKAIRIYRGHTSEAVSVAWSPDGKLLASGSGDNTVHIWDASSGTTLLTYTGHTDTVASVVWTLDGKLLASGSHDKTVHIWDASRGQTLFVCTGHTWGVTSVAWSPIGKILASASIDSTVRLWNSGNGQLLSTYFNNNDPVNSVAWSPNGQRLAVASYDSTVRLWDAGDGYPLFTYTGHRAPVDSVAWSPNGKQLVSASDDRTVRLWDAWLSTGRTELTYLHTGGVFGVVWLPGDRQLASTSDDQTVRLWDSSNGQTIFIYTGHTNTVTSVTRSPDGKVLASASLDGTVRLWDTKNGQALFTYTDHTDGVKSVMWSPDGKRLASASADNSVRVWNAKNGQTIFTCTGHTGAVNGVAWSPDGKSLASAGSDGTARLWDAENGQPIYTHKGDDGEMFSVAWSPDSSRVASTGPTTIYIWGAEIITYTGPTNWINSVAWSPDGKYLASASNDKMVYIWDAEGRQTHSLYAYQGHSDFVNGVAWSSDSKHLASASYDRTVQVWLWGLDQ